MTTSIRMCAVAVLSLLGCADDEAVPTDAPIAVDAAIDTATDAATDTAVCACDVSSCGARICGRSACGFPCGECAPDQACFTGTQCQPGPGPGTPCVDAFGDRVWEGDRGFRTCPTDAAQQQACTCTGAGPAAWASCDATCVSICAPAAIASHR